MSVLVIDRIASTSLRLARPIRRRGERVGEHDAGQQLPRPPGLERAHEAAEVGSDAVGGDAEQRVGAGEAEMGQDGARFGGQEVLERLVTDEGPGAKSGDGCQRLGQAGDISQGIVETTLETLGFRLQDGGEDGAAPREVAVQGGPGDAGLAGDVVDGQLGEAEPGDGTEGAVDNLGRHFR